MKKIVLFTLLIATAIFLLIFGVYAMNLKDDDVKTTEEDIAEDIDFPYAIELGLTAVQGETKSRWYDITVNKTENAVELTIKYNGENFDYTPAWMKDGSYEYGDELPEYVTMAYEYTEKIKLSKDQYEAMADIIAKIQSYDYDEETKSMIDGSLFYFPRYAEVVRFLAIQNDETGENNELEQCEYFLINDKNARELIRKLTELSPIPVLNYYGESLYFKEPKETYDTSTLIAEGVELSEETKRAILKSSDFFSRKK